MKVGGPALDTIFVECQVTVAAVDLVLGPGDDDGQVNGNVIGRLYGDAGQDTLTGGTRTTSSRARPVSTPCAAARATTSSTGRTRRT